MTTEFASLVLDMTTRARVAARVLASACNEAKADALRKIAVQLRAAQDGILAANALDMEEGRAKGL